jgi:hypothetical protein
LNREELIQLSDLNLAEGYREFTRRSPNGVIHEEDGLLLYAGSHPSPIIVNGAIRTDPRLAPDEALARAESFFADRGHRFCFCVSEHADGDVEEAAADRGYRMVIDLTAMVLDHRLEDRPMPAGAELQWVENETGVHDFAEVTAEAFEERDMVMATFVEPRMLSAPHIASVVAYLDGQPVSAAMTVVSYGVALVGLVGTKFAARGRGLGEAVTRAVTNAGFDMGARLASLQASPEGDAIYRRLGYLEVSHYREYLAPEREEKALIIAGGLRA